VISSHHGLLLETIQHSLFVVDNESASANQQGILERLGQLTIATHVQGTRDHSRFEKEVGGSKGHGIMKSSSSPSRLSREIGHMQLNFLAYSSSSNVLVLFLLENNFPNREKEAFSNALT
jgi:hypothetical protein